MVRADTISITSGMQNMLAGGGLEDIIPMFAGGSKANGQNAGIGGLLKNPMVMIIAGHLISKLTGKFNMSPAQASKVSNSLIPNVLKDMVTRTNSQVPQDDTFDLNDLIRSLTGGNAGSPGGFDFQDLPGQLTGGGANAGEGFDLHDIISRVSKGAQENRAREIKPCQRVF